jgi:hypothetical protein
MRKLTYVVGADVEAGQNTKKHEISHTKKKYNYHASSVLPKPRV